MIYIVIPVFNRLKFTLECLHSLNNQTTKDFKIIIVDDGSTDGTQEVIRKEYPHVILLETSGDLYWTATINVGIKYAIEHNAEYVLTLNNDTLASKDFIKNIIVWSRKYPMALFGAYAIDAISKQPVYGGEIIDWKRIRSKSWLDILPVNEHIGIHKVSHFPGRGLLIPVSCFEKIGYFDEITFPHYAADYDFTHKAIRNGFEIYCNHDAKLLIYPDESGDRHNRKKKNLKNYINHLFNKKGGGNLRNFTLYVIRNCPIVYVPSYLVVGYLRRLIGFWIK